MIHRSFLGAKLALQITLSVCMSAPSAMPVSAARRPYCSSEVVVVPVELLHLLITRKLYQLKLIKCLSVKQNKDKNRAFEKIDASKDWVSKTSCTILMFV